MSGLIAILVQDFHIILLLANFSVATDVMSTHGGLGYLGGFEGRRVVFVQIETDNLDSLADHFTYQNTYNYHHFNVGDEL